MPDAAPELSVVVPIYDAAGFVEERLTSLHAFLTGAGLDFELIVVDDGSGDDSAKRVEALGLSRTRLLRRGENGGKFAALGDGMARPTGRGCLFTDADVPYDLSIVPQMVQLVNDRGFHLAIGDRNLPDSSFGERLPPVRAVATRLFTLFVRLFVTSGVSDTQCGIKAFRGDVARALFPLLRETGFAGDVELLYVALKHNLTIRRLPTRLVYQGRSTVRPVRDGLAMARAVWSLPARHRAGAYASPELARLARED